jgi:hypothetical protein
MEKMQLNPLEIAANHEIQSKDVKRLFSKLQTTPQKRESALLLEELHDIPLAIASVISRNIRLDAPKVNRLSDL